MVNFALRFHQPPKKLVFSPWSRDVVGTLSVTFDGPIDNVKCIQAHFKGLAVATYIHEHFTTEEIVDMDGSRRQYQEPHLADIREEYPLFFDTSKLLEAESEQDLLSFSAGQELRFDLRFEFPSDEVLPSSCSGHGESAPKKGWFDVKYGLEFEIVRPKEFSRIVSHFPVLYQCGLDNSFGPTTNIITADKRTFRHNVKRLIYDRETRTLVKNPLGTPHTRTRAIRQIWNSNYKLQNFKELVKDVSLTVQLCTPSRLDLSADLCDFGKLVFFCNGISALEPDFRMKQTSTELGLFKITNIRVEIMSSIHIRVEDHEAECEGNAITLYNHDFNLDSEPELDVASFRRSSDSFYHVIPMHRLVPSGSCLNFLDRPVMPTVALSTYFSNMNRIRVSVTLAHALNRSHSRTFVMENHLILGFADKEIPDYSAIVHTPAPAYNSPEMTPDPVLLSSCDETHFYGAPPQYSTLHAIR